MSDRIQARDTDAKPLLSLCLIAKNEKQNVRRLLDSCWEWVDEVCVADTGSKDGTVAEFRRYARERRQPGKLKVTRFEWCDDFAAARQAADDLASGEWVTWADMDDTVNGLSQLRELAAQATPDVSAFFVRYSYARDETGNAISELWRERVVRNIPELRWRDRLHEHKLMTVGTVVKVGPEIAEWIHHRDHTQRTGERNIAILESWLADAPDDPQVIHGLALEYMGSDRPQDAVDMFKRFLKSAENPPDRRAQATRQMCMMLQVLERPAEAIEQAQLSLQRDGFMWADTHLSLAEAEQALGHPAAGLFHADCAQRIGQPDTLLIINPLQYTAHPLAVKAICLGQLGRIEEGVRCFEEALQIAPAYPLAAQHLPRWRAELKKEQALGTVLALCEVLIEVGELVKARDLLSLAPHYIDSDRRLVAKRVQLQREIDRRVAQPADTAEDEAADAFVHRHQQAEAVAA